VNVLPNFFVVGAPVSGTTALHDFLHQHPDIYVSPIKEPDFFSSSSDSPDWDTYLKLFDGVTGETAVGECSVSYLSSEQAPQRIAASIPHARILMMLRNPVDRLNSGYAWALSTGATRASFSTWAHGQYRLEESRNSKHGVVWTGMYAQHLRRYLAHFPREQIGVFLYDDYIADPQATLREVFTFLNIDPSVEVDVSRRHNPTRTRRLPRVHSLLVAPFTPLLKLLPQRVEHALRGWYRTSPEPPSAAGRSAVMQIYREDIRDLEQLLGKRLGWN
jgi:hypothetical protein